MKKNFTEVESFIRGTDKLTKDFFTQRYLPDFLPIDETSDEMNDRRCIIHKLPVKVTQYLKIGEGKSKQIKKTIEIRYSSIFRNANITTDRIINGFDRRVHDAICNLFSLGYTYLTYHQIYQFIYHNKPMNKKDLNKLKESIDRIRWTWLKIDLTEEVEAYGYVTESAIIDTYLIAMEKIQIAEMADHERKKLHHVGFNNVKEIIHVLSMPPMLRLWIDRKQIQSIPRDLTNDCPISQNRWNIEIWEHLLDLLAIAGRYHTVTFNYDNFAAAIKLPPKRIPTLPNRIKEILSWFQEKHFVSTYEDTTDTDGHLKGLKVVKEKPK